MLNPVRSGAGKSPRRGWVAALQGYVAPAVERCELCRTSIPPRHPHLLDVERRAAVCACLGCATVLGAKPDGRFRRIPPTVERLADFRMSDAEWASLQIPIGLAFLVSSTAAGGPVALYPGPAGATESRLDPEAWAVIVENNPRLADMAPDVEALVVNRIGGRREHVRLSIDRCFELIALFRKHWRGFSGGDEVWEAVEEFFAGVATREPQSRRRSHG